MVEGDLRRLDPRTPDERGRTMLHLRSTANLRLHPVGSERFVFIRRGGQWRNRTAILLGRRPDCDMLINDYTVSAVHARMHVIPQLGRVLCEDLNSTNGTAHNGELLLPGTKSMLVNGDSLYIGRMGFAFFTAVAFWRYLVGEWKWGAVA